MTKRVEILKPGALKTLPPGDHADGGGLLFRVGKEGSARSWILRYWQDGRERRMGLGGYPLVSLALARRWATEARLKVRAGGDPIQEKADARAARRAHRDAEKVTNFGEFAAKYIAAHRTGWRSAKHAHQWEATVSTQPEPLGGPSDHKIDPEHVLSVLRPSWQSRPETGNRVRQRLEVIINAAKVDGIYPADNPAKLELIEPTLGKFTRLKKVANFTALPYAELPTLMADLATKQSMPALALRLCLLTATRTGETRLAEWNEFDFDGKIWSIPSTRTKSGREHRVPLSDAAVALLQSVPRDGGDLVFWSARQGSTIAEDALRLAFKSTRPDSAATVHGLRAAFKSWGSDMTNHPTEIVEMSLGHTVGNSVERAYRRTDLLEKRRKLMDDWAQYLAAPGC